MTNLAVYISNEIYTLLYRQPTELEISSIIVEVNPDRLIFKVPLHVSLIRAPISNKSINTLFSNRLFKGTLNYYLISNATISVEYNYFVVTLTYQLSS